MSIKKDFNNLTDKYGIEFPDNIVTSVFKVPGKIALFLPVPIYVYRKAQRQVSGLYNIYEKIWSDISSTRNYTIKEEQIDLETAIKKLHNFEVAVKKDSKWKMYSDNSKESQISSPYYKFVAELMDIDLYPDDPDGNKAFSIPFNNKPDK